jgi:hypothetical protein
MISRRSLFRGLGAILSAPPIAKVAALIPALEVRRIRSLDYLNAARVTREAMLLFQNSNSFLQSIDFPAGSKVGTRIRIKLPTDYRVS